MEDNLSDMSKSNGGTGISWFGVIVAYAGNLAGQIFDYWIAIVLVGMAITMVGCVLWVQRKHRHIAFALWGLLAPIGFLGISLLKDRNTIEPE